MAYLYAVCHADIFRHFRHAALAALIAIATIHRRHAITLPPPLIQRYADCRFHTHAACRLFR